MKKILFMLLIMFSCNLYSQESVIDLFKSKEKRAKELVEKKEKQKAKEEINLRMQKQPKMSIAQSGLYLEKSAKMQGVALGLGAVSSGLLIWYGCIDDKFEYKNGDSKLTSKGKGLIASGAVFAIAAIGCEIMSINYKMKAGKCLRFQASGDKVGLALVF